MPTEYTVQYLSPSGVFIVNLQYSKFVITRKENDIGTLTLDLPPIYHPSLFRPERRIEIRRSMGPDQNTLLTNTVWLIRRVHYAIDKDGAETLQLDAFDLNVLFKRRMVAYDAGTLYADKLDIADDLMKDLIRENYGSLVFDPDNTGRDISAWVDVQV